jgi:hypothetical protein
VNARIDHGEIYEIRRPAVRKAEDGRRPDTPPQPWYEIWAGPDRARQQGGASTIDTVAIYASRKAADRGAIADRPSSTRRRFSRGGERRCGMKSIKFGELSLQRSRVALLAPCKISGTPKKQRAHHTAIAV